MIRKIALLISTMLIAAMVFTACSQPTQQPTTTPESTQAEVAPIEVVSYIHDDLLVDVEWLNNNLGNVIIIDARDEKEYKANHIPNAINTGWQPFTDMAAIKPGDKGWGTVLSADKLGAVIGSFGIDGTKPVVVYAAAPKGWGDDGRIVWTLRMAGIKNAKILNGGWDAWVAKGFAKDVNAPTITPASYSVTELDESLNIGVDYVSQNLNKIKIIDAREEEEYFGATKYGEARGGHIPGAINITWSKVFNADGTVKNQKDLEALFTSSGINKTDEIVTYCTKGIRSGHMALILKMAGYENAKNYDGSFYEWAGNKDLPIEQ